ncbi:hypothetical protein F4778DRAFT_748456 [Xylariomycetidae sp. FL2044]|nr:hypothetical protein F4778DRAFT_748456 [Xylariomycetidae sp. FL2044]
MAIREIPSPAESKSSGSASAEDNWETDTVLEEQEEEKEDPHKEKSSDQCVKDCSGRCSVHDEENGKATKRRLNPWMVAGGTVCAAGLITVAAPAAVVGLAGFGSGGVVGGSLAAAIQGGIGNVAAGSAFAICQSAGAGGAGATVVSMAGGVASAVGGATAAAASRCSKKDCSGRCSRHDRGADEVKL